MLNGDAMRVLFCFILTCLVFLFVGCQSFDSTSNNEPSFSSISIEGISSVRLNHDSASLLLGTNTNSFIYQSLSGTFQKRYPLPDTYAPCYLVYELVPDEFLVGERDQGLMYLRYTDVREEPRLQKVVCFSAESDEKPFKHTNYSVYQLLSLGDSLFLAATSNGLLYMSPSLLREARNSEGNCTLPITYTSFLKKKRNRQMQYAIENIYKGENSLLVTTQDGVYRTPFNLILHPDCPAIEVGAEPLAESKVQFSYLRNDTLFVLSRSKADGHNRQYSHYVVHPFSEKPEVKSYEEPQPLISKYPAFSIYGNGELELRSSGKRFSLRMTDYHTYAHLCIQNQLYFISGSELKSVNLETLRKEALQYPVELFVPADGGKQYIVDADHQLFELKENNNRALLLGRINGIKEKLRHGTVCGGQLYVSSRDRLYKVSVFPWGLAKERRARQVNSDQLIDREDEIVSLANCCDTALFIGFRGSLKIYNPQKTVQGMFLSIFSPKNINRRM